jgi:hypothetical protein
MEVHYDKQGIGAFSDPFEAESKKDWIAIMKAMLYDVQHSSVITYKEYLKVARRKGGPCRACEEGLGLLPYTPIE